IAKLDAAVVTVSTNKSLGSGFIIDKRGIVVTNYHVVALGHDGVTVTFSDGDVKEVVGFYYASALRDLAILQVEEQTDGYPTLPLSAELPEKGTKVYAYGSPHGLQGSLSTGIISGIRDGTHVTALLQQTDGGLEPMFGFHQKLRWIQTTAAIDHGN